LPTRSRKPRLPDPNAIAFGVLQAITGELPPDTPNGENPAAIMLGRLGGSKGGKARAAKMTKKEQTASAKESSRYQAPPGNAVPRGSASLYSTTAKPTHSRSHGVRRYSTARDDAGVPGLIDGIAHWP
jgi:hypothetical protein